MAIGSNKGSHSNVLGAKVTKSCRRVAIVPGNGGGDVHRANWYGWLYRTLKKNEDLECKLENMPDPVIASEKVWLPFMETELQCDEDCIIVGHRYYFVCAGSILIR